MCCIQEEDRWDFLLEACSVSIAFSDNGRDNFRRFSLVPRNTLARTDKSQRPVRGLIFLFFFSRTKRRTVAASFPPKRNLLCCCGGSFHFNLCILFTIYIAKQSRAGANRGDASIDLFLMPIFDLSTSKHLRYHCRADSLRVDYQQTPAPTNRCPCPGTA